MTFNFPRSLSTTARNILVSAVNENHGPLKAGHQVRSFLYDGARAHYDAAVELMDGHYLSEISGTNPCTITFSAEGAAYANYLAS